MKKLILASIVSILFSCLDDNDDCVKVHPFGELSKTSKSTAVKTDERLLLEYIDINGENIFENGTYDPKGVTLSRNGEMYTDVVDLYNEETKYLIWVGGQSEGKNLFAVSLALTDSRIDHLTVYTTQVDFNSCTGPSFAIDSVFHNDEKLAFKKVSDRLKKVTVTR